MTSPPSPQPKQCHAPTAGRMLKDGLFSSWKGHRPLSDPGPAERSVTCSRTTSSIDERSLPRATSSALTRPATPPPQLVPESRRSGREIPDDLPSGHAPGVPVAGPGIQRHGVEVALGRGAGPQTGGELADDRERGRGGLAE